MVWKGFIKESQLFLNYPKCGRWYFWSRLPYKYINFGILVLRFKYYWIDKIYKFIKKED